MRRFKISVDGVAYDVAVEELDLDGKETPVKPREMPVANASPAVGNLPPKIPRPTPAPQANAGDVVSPLAGTVIEVKVSAGQTVKSGEPLLLLEAMKMESVVGAPIDGRVQSIAVSAGQPVQEGQILLSLTPV